MLFLKKPRQHLSILISQIEVPQLDFLKLNNIDYVEISVVSYENYRLPSFYNIIAFTTHYIDSKNKNNLQSIKN